MRFNLKDTVIAWKFILRDGMVKIMEIIDIKNIEDVNDLPEKFELVSNKYDSLFNIKQIRDTVNNLKNTGYEIGLIKCSGKKEEGYNRYIVESSGGLK